MAKLWGILQGYIFERVCGLLDDQHSCARILGRNRYLSWFAQLHKKLSVAEKV